MMCLVVIAGITPQLGAWIFLSGIQHTFSSAGGPIPISVDSVAGFRSLSLLDQQISETQVFFFVLSKSRTSNGIPGLVFYIFSVQSPPLPIL